MNLEIGYDLDTLLGHVALDYKLTLGENATGDTPMYWADVISGNAYYYYVDENSVQSLEMCKFYFNTNISQGYGVIRSDKVSIMGIRRDSISGSTPVSLAVGSSNLSISGGSVWQYGVSLNPPYTGKANSASIIVYDNATGVGASTPKYNVLSNETSNLPNYFASTNWRGLNYTTSQAVHSRNSNVPYMPISGRTMSYNDLRQYIVNEYNEQNPSETISVDDLPAFDEDEIEPTYDIQPFSIDYNEILGEREMESIIAETRYVLDTTPYEIESLDYQQAISEPYEELKKVAVLDADTKTAMSKIYDVALAMTENDFLPLYAFGAILSIVMWFVFRR